MYVLQFWKYRCKSEPTDTLSWTAQYLEPRLWGKTQAPKCLNHKGKHRAGRMPWYLPLDPTIYKSHSTPKSTHSPRPQWLPETQTAVAQSRLGISDQDLRWTVQSLSPRPEGKPWVPPQPASATRVSLLRAGCHRPSPLDLGIYKSHSLPKPSHYQRPQQLSENRLQLHKAEQEVSDQSPS